MMMALYRTPMKFTGNMSALGLCHVVYKIPAEYSGVLRLKPGPMLKIFSQTVTEGSTIVMQAVNVHNVKSLKKRRPVLCVASQWSGSLLLGPPLKLRARHPSFCSEGS